MKIKVKSASSKENPIDIIKAVYRLKLVFQYLQNLINLIIPPNDLSFEIPNDLKLTNEMENVVLFEPNMWFR